MKRKSISEIRKFTHAAYKRNKDLLESLKPFTDSSNPQYMQSMIECKARSEAYESVLQALNGDCCLLMIAGE